MKTCLSQVLILFIISQAPLVQAGSVWKIKGKTVFLEFNKKDDVRVNDLFEVVDSETHKKTGLIEILSVDKNHAVAEVRKGKAVLDGTFVFYSEGGRRQSKVSQKDKAEQSASTDSESETDDLLAEVLGPVELKKAKAKKESADDDDGVGVQKPSKRTNPREDDEIEEEPPPKPRRIPSYFGVGFGLSPTTLVIKTATHENKLIGSNFVVRLCFDKNFQGNFSGLLGMSYIPISGTQADKSLGTAKFDGAYGSLELNGRVSFYSPTQGPWLSAGVNVLNSLSKPTSNLVDASQLSNIVAFQLGLGYNVSMAPDYFTFRGDLIVHPQTTISSSTVDITQYMLSAIYFY